MQFYLAPCDFTLLLERLILKLRQFLVLGLYIALLYLCLYDCVFTLGTDLLLYCPFHSLNHLMQIWSIQLFPSTHHTLLDLINAKRYTDKIFTV